MFYTNGELTKTNQSHQVVKSVILQHLAEVCSIHDVIFYFKMAGFNMVSEVATM